MSSINLAQFSHSTTEIGLASSLKGGPVESSSPSFKEVLSNKEGVSFVSEIRSGLEKLDASWKQSYAQSAKMMSALPKEHKALFDAQVSVSRMHFQTELVTKIGDSVQGTMKRLQQQGS